MMSSFIKRGIFISIDHRFTVISLRIVPFSSELVRRALCIWHPKELIKGLSQTTTTIGTHVGTALMYMVMEWFRVRVLFLAPEVVLVLKVKVNSFSDETQNPEVPCHERR